MPFEIYRQQYVSPQRLGVSAWTTRKWSNRPSLAKRNRLAASMPAHLWSESTEPG
jgi:hypothetical protein